MSDNAHLYAIDDDRAFLSSLETFFRQHGIQVKSYLNPATFLAEVPLDSAGCLVLDLQMPEINGLDLQKQLADARSPLSIVVVTGVANVATAVRVMERGAVTLLEKPYDHEELLKAVRHGISVSEKRKLKLRSEQNVRDRLAQLNDEEQQVLKCMLVGEPNKQIASSLNLSMRTVDRRRQSVLDKMQARTVPELAVMLGSAGAIDKEGLVLPPEAERPDAD